jgi:hypothetical protein
LNIIAIDLSSEGFFYRLIFLRRTIGLITLSLLRYVIVPDIIIIYRLSG